MKIREDLNKGIFNETTVTELLDNLDKLISCVECFVDPDVDGNNICGALIKVHTQNIVNSPILKPFVYAE